MTEDRTPEDRMASFRANNQRAIAALEAVAAYAQTAPWQTSSLPAGADQERDRERLSRVLCGVRHLSDQFYGLRFYQIRGTADELYTWARTAVPGSSAGAEAAAAAIDIYELTMPARMRRPGSFWPLGSLAEFHSYASSRGISREAAVARLTSGLVASLRQYADHQGLDFGIAMAAGLRAHAQQCLSAYGPIDTGLVPDRRPAVILTRSPLRRRSSLSSPTRAWSRRSAMPSGCSSALRRASSSRNSAGTSPATVILMTAAR